jgi:hypothetical protein
LLKAAHVDIIGQALRGLNILYSKEEIVFDLVAGPRTYTVKARHKWKGSSIFNDTHALQVGWERGGHNFDVSIGGHTHVGTFCTEFYRHQKRRYAILTGTYKTEDSFAREIGFAQGMDSGCGALVFNKRGEFTFHRNLGLAADYLDFLRLRG